MADIMKQAKDEVKDILDQIKELPDEKKRIILASLKGMLLVTEVHKAGS